MPLKIECQKVDTWKKKIIRDDLKGLTYFCQQGGAVFVTASIDHQSICEYVLDQNGDGRILVNPKAINDGTM